LNILIVPECGHNWCNDFKMAEDLISAAADSGATCAKFQLYDTDKIKKPGDTNYEELKAAELSRDQIEKLQIKCDKVGIDLVASAFDIERVGWLEDIGVPFHKLASRCIYDTGLIKAMEDTGIEILVSTAELGDNELPEMKNAEFLFCRSRRQILRDGFDTFPLFSTQFGNCYRGFSDHTVGMERAKEAMDKGAVIIEKHFTFDKNLPGWDQPGSMTPDELKDLVKFAEGYNAR